MSAADSNTLLVVDDTPANINVLVPTLEEAGFDVLVATNGIQALERARLGAPELILLDILMPELDGLETCRRLKQDPAMRDIPVIFMTALHDVGEKVAGFAAGGVDYITKPFASEEVLERVRTHVTLRRLQRDLQRKNVLLEATTGQLTALSAALTCFLRTGSLADATALLLADALRRAGAACGWMGMLSGDGARVLAVQGSDRSLAELQRSAGPLIDEARTRLARGERQGIAVRGDGCYSFAVVERDDVVGWLTIADPQASPERIAPPGIEQLLHGAGVLYAYQRLSEREAETQRGRARAEETASYLREEIETEQHAGRMIARSESLRAVLATVERIARTDSTVLILGETGTGKEMVARSIHDLSPRSARLLVKVNCAAIPENLVESELFGHEKGAFTGATAARKGRFELADGGTIFLDEVGDMPLLAQSKLLRVLQEREFERLGASRPTRVDVRVLAATHRDLPKLVEEGRFREDLYYRLNVVPIRLPPLRERPEDITTLASCFLSRFAVKHGVPVERLSEQSLQRLVAYRWPGNVRELENIIERAVILASDPTVELSTAMLPEPPARGVPQAPPAVPAQAPEAPDAAPLSGTLDEVQQEYMLRVLERARWVIEGPNGAAAQLGLKPSTLRHRMHKLGIHKLGAAVDDAEP